MAELARTGATLVWSPLSNVLLYGQTTPVQLARKAGVPVALGSNWGPSGTKSLLGELKVADLWNIGAGRVYTDRELVEMVTTNPARALGWSDWAGHISEGTVADLVLIDSSVADPYRNLIAATEVNVRMVLVAGTPVYGDADALAMAGVTKVEPVGRLGSCEKVVALPISAGSREVRPALAEARKALSEAFNNFPKPGPHLDSLFTANDSWFFETLESTHGLPAWLRGLRDRYRSATLCPSEKD